MKERIKVGKKIKIITQGNEARYGVREYEAIIKSIGRKWFKVESDSIRLVDLEFSLENGLNNGKGYISNYLALIDEEHENEVFKKPKYKSEILNKINKVDFNVLEKIYNIIKDENTSCKKS